MAKMTVCKACGNEVAKSAKACPNCGAKIKKPIYKRVWFWILIVVVLLGIIGIAGSGDSEDPSGDATAQVEENNDAATDEGQDKQKIEYTSYDVTELFDDINNNALDAEKKHQDEYVEITGYLGTIDSDGNYFGIEADPDNYDYMFQNVQVTMTDDSQVEYLSGLSKGDQITVRGQITQIGEVLGYTLDMDEWVTE